MSKMSKIRWQFIVAFDVSFCFTHLPQTLRYLYQPVRFVLIKQAGHVYVLINLFQLPQI